MIDSCFQVASLTNQLGQFCCRNSHVLNDYPYRCPDDLCQALADNRWGWVLLFIRFHRWCVPLKLVVPSFLTFLGLFWGASLRKIPHVRYFFYVKFSWVDITYVGCLGSSHAGLNPDVVHAILDMG